MNKSISKKEIFSEVSEIEDRVNSILDNIKMFDIVVGESELDSEIEDRLYDSLTNYEDTEKAEMIEEIEDIINRLVEEVREIDVTHIGEEVKYLFIDELEYIINLLDSYDFEAAKVFLNEFEDIESRNKRNTSNQRKQDKEDQKKQQAIEIFKLEGQGLTLKQIAKQLSISLRTVHNRKNKYKGVL